MRGKTIGVASCRFVDRLLIPTSNDPLKPRTYTKQSLEWFDPVAFACSSLDGLKLMDGVLIIDKPAGLTSHDVVARVRRILGERRIGHTGTLDPFATGVLVLLLGRATRLAQFLSGAEKEYEAVVRLGFATDTGDITGKPMVEAGVSEASPSPTEQEIDAVLNSLRGEIEQVPPMYSAKKQSGQKLYELARRGQEVEREAVSVTIYSLEALRNIAGLLTNNQESTTDISIRVVCSAGTYVRTLAEDFGKRLGVGAHVAELRRTRAGDFSIKDALSLEQLDQHVTTESLSKILVSPDAALQRLPFVSLTAVDVCRTQQGLPLKLQTEPESISGADDSIRMRDEMGKLIAVGTYDREAQLLRPRVVLATEKAG